MKKMVIYSILILICTTSAVAGQSSVKLKDLVVTGYGSSEQDSIQSALIEAVRQVHGVTINSTEIYALLYSENSAVSDGEGSTETYLNETLSRQGSFKQNGYLQSYKVMDTSIGADGLYHSKVKVVIPYYETPGFKPEQRRNLALLPTECDQEHVNFPDSSFNADYIARQFSQALISEITQTRRFAILDRENIQHYFDEKNLILSNDSPKSEHVRFGKLLGTDYVLLTSIDEAYAHTQEVSLDMIGEKKQVSYGLIKASYRIVVMSTQQIKWADTITLTLDSPEIRKVMGSNVRFDTYADVLITGMAHRITMDLIENIYPVKIIEVTGNKFIVNIGGQSVAVGDRYAVFSLGEMLKDPYSGEQLGRKEECIGYAQVARLTSKIAYLDMIEGNFDQLKVGCIIRRDSALDQPVRSESTESPKRSDGVKLPFDN